MNNSKKGISCPMCSHSESKVEQTRKKIGKVIRWRRCLNCDFTYKTSEVILHETEIKGAGLVCPKCGCPENTVYTTFRTSRKTIRYRKCADCGHNFRTEEKNDMIPILYTKDGEKEYPLFLKTLANDLEKSKIFAKSKDEINIIKEIVEAYFAEIKPNVERKALIPIVSSEEAFNIIFSSIYAVNETRAAIYCNSKSYVIKKRKKNGLYEILVSNKNTIKATTRIKKSLGKKKKVEKVKKEKAENKLTKKNTEKKDENN